jgi:hypothetical protein
MSFGFIARVFGMTGPFVRISTTLPAVSSESLSRNVQLSLYSFGGWLQPDSKWRCHLEKRKGKQRRQ